MMDQESEISILLIVNSLLISQAIKQQLGCQVIVETATPVAEDLESILAPNIPQVVIIDCDSILVENREKQTNDIEGDCLCSLIYRIKYISSDIKLMYPFSWVKTQIGKCQRV